MTVIDKNTTFLGYRRENGRVGVRNHVIILPLDDLSNAAAEAVAHNIKGALAIPHPYGRLQFGADLELHFRTLIGTGCNPNVAAVVEGITPGAGLTAWIMDDDKQFPIAALQAIPIGHKIALKDMAIGDTVFKYGTDIGRVVAPIKAGEHAHVHNIKTKRW